MARTHTVFWNMEDLGPLLREADKLRADMESRAPHIDAEPLADMKRRIDNLDNAIKFMCERAD